MRTASIHVKISPKEKAELDSLRGIIPLSTFVVQMIQDGLARKKDPQKKTTKP